MGRDYKVGLTICREGSIGTSESLFGLIGVIVPYM